MTLTTEQLRAEMIEKIAVASGLRARDGRNVVAEAIYDEVVAPLLANWEAQPVQVTDGMALDFHRALTDSDIGKDDLEEIKIGLRAALCNVNALLTPRDAQPVAWSYEWASCITCEGPQNFKPVIEREAPPQWAINEGQARNVTLLYAAPPAPAARIAGYFVRQRPKWDERAPWTPWKEVDEASYADIVKIIATGEAYCGWFYDTRILYTAPPAPTLPTELLDAVDEVIRISDRDHDAWARAKEAITAYRAAMLAAAPATPEESSD